jgi:hypothetical protein
MATISQILAKRWPGREWTISGDDYNTLIWGHMEDGQLVNTNPEPKPSLAEILAFSDDVDLEIAVDRRDEERDAFLQDTSPGQFFKAIDVITDYLAALHQALPGNVRSQIPATVVNRMQAMRNRINQIITQLP